MVRVEADRVLCNLPPAIVVERFPGVGVHVEAREVAARNIEPDSVTALKDQRRRIHLDRKLVRHTWSKQFFLRGTVPESRPDDAVGDIQIEPGGEVRIRGDTSMSFAVKSVSVALDAAHSLTINRPVISRFSVSGAVWNTTTSPRVESGFESEHNQKSERQR